MIDEYADLSQRNSPELLFDLMGFGQIPAAFDENRLSYLKSSFAPSLELVADALSIPLDSVQVSGEVATAQAERHDRRGRARRPEPWPGSAPRFPV